MTGFSVGGGAIGEGAPCIQNCKNRYWESNEEKILRVSYVMSWLYNGAQATLNLNGSKIIIHMFLMCCEKFKFLLWMIIIFHPPSYVFIPSQLGTQGYSSTIDRRAGVHADTDF